MTHPLDPGPEVRAVWTEDSDKRRALAHYPGSTHLDYEKWGDHVLDMLLPEWEPGGCVSVDIGYGRVLDWGCGGCALLDALKNRIVRQRWGYVGVDVDPAIRELGHGPRGELGDGCTMIGGLTPDQAHLMADGKTDYIVSTAAFQHFPSFDYARAVLREMRRVAAPNARGLIQTRYFVPGDSFDPAGIQKLPYREAFTRYCAWQVPDFWGELEQAGFAPSDVVLEPERQAAWYRFGVK